MFAGELAKPSSICLGAFDTESDALVGYLIISRYVDAWHVMNIAVAPSERRRGIAQDVLQRVRRRSHIEVSAEEAGAVMVVVLQAVPGYSLVLDNRPAVLDITGERQAGDAIALRGDEIVLLIEGENEIMDTLIVDEAGNLAGIITRGICSERFRNS